MAAVGQCVARYLHDLGAESFSRGKKLWGNLAGRMGLTNEAPVSVGWGMEGEGTDAVMVYTYLSIYETDNALVSIHSAYCCLSIA